MDSAASGDQPVGSELASPRARRSALVLSWLAYATYYLGRKGLSVVKASLAAEQGLSAQTLALIDTGYLLAYAAGQVPSGLAADRWGPRRLLGFGMLLSAAACLGMGAAHGALVLFLCFALNGAAQSTGWPGATKVVAQVIGPGQRGRVMGVWSTCYQVGGMVATALATWLLAHFGWRSVFRVPAFALSLVAVLLVVALRAPAQPTSVRVQLPRASRDELRSVLRAPLLYSYGASYFCIKLIRYSLLFWLPYYLHTAAGFGEIESGYLSTAFEIGGTFGSVGLGYISDRFPQRRAYIAALSLVALAAAMALYASLGVHSALWHFTCLALVGALLFGPDALISGAAAQDVAGSLAAGTAVGLVNGLGSLGALLQGALTVGIQQAYGWNTLLHVFVALSLLAASCLLLARAQRSSLG
jgi:OPA family sugar phosphate sensor protein UhpC-like MFS transporter